MKLRNLFAAVMASAVAFVACEQEKVDLGTPSITLSVEEITLEATGGEASVDVTATRDWTVTMDDAASEWLVVDPNAGEASATAQTVTVSALSNEGYDREASVAFTIGMQTKYLTVKQTGAQGSADALVIYANDYDKEVAEKTYGSGSSWPYLDQFEGWKNQTGTGAANVTYAFSGMSARANSTSNSNYSDYPGSGNNNMFFGKSAYFATNGIALSGATNLELTFGTEKYSQDNGSVFKNEEFHIWLSADGGAKWVELTDYTFAGGTTEGRWNVATANFSVPAGTETLSICMAVDIASSYRMDDFKLVATDKEGTAVDFSKAAAKDFGAGTTGGNTGGDNTGGEVTPPADAIFFESFASGKGEFTIDDKTIPTGFTAVWEHSSQYTCMKATAYKNDTQENFASEGWLISPEIDLSSQTAAFLTFEHAGGYFGTASNEATLWISKDGGAWTQLTIADAAYPTSWTFTSAGTWDLKDYVGSKVKIAFKYTSTAEKAGTWEIKNVSVTSGAPTAGGGNIGGDVDLGSGEYDASIVFKDAGYANAESVADKEIKIDDNITAVFAKGGANTPPAYYTSGEAIRMYQNGATLDVKAAEGKTITEIRLTFGDDQYYLGCDVGELSAEASTRVWTGSSNAVKFTATGTDKSHRAYVASIEVAYE